MTDMDTTPADRLRAALRASGPLPRRHPAEVTADRLGDDVARYGHMMTGAERDELSHVRYVLQEIAEGNRETIDTEFERARGGEDQ